MISRLKTLSAPLTLSPWSIPTLRRPLPKFQRYRNLSSLTLTFPRDTTGSSAPPQRYDVSEPSVTIRDHDLPQLFSYLSKGYTADTEQLSRWLLAYETGAEGSNDDTKHLFFISSSCVVQLTKDSHGKIHETVQRSGECFRAKTTRIRTATGLRNRAKSYLKSGLVQVKKDDEFDFDFDLWVDTKVDNKASNSNLNSNLNLKPADTEIPPQEPPEVLHIKLQKFDAKLRQNRVWEVRIENAEAVIRWGIEGSEHEQERRLHFTEGKQKRSPHHQAIMESLSRARKVLRRGYRVDVVSDGAYLRLLEAEKQDLPPLPCLAYNMNFSAGNLEDTAKVVIQPKLDGLRCIGDLLTGKLWSRTRKPFNVPGVSERLVGSGSGELRWVDGELYRHGIGIQQLNSMIRNNQENNAAKSDVQFHVFDAVLDRPFLERFKAVEQWIDGLRHKTDAEDQVVQLVETLQCEAAKIEEWHTHFVGLGYEGVMIRPVNNVAYESGKRTKNLLKCKKFFTEEYDLVEILPQRFENNGQIVTASVTVLTPDGQVFQATPKCSIAEKQEMWDNREMYANGQWKAIIAFTELTERGVPRFPVLVGFRNRDELEVS